MFNKPTRRHDSLAAWKWIRTRRHIGFSFFSSLHQPCPDQFNQSSSQPDVNYLMKSIWMCGCACIRAVSGIGTGGILEVILHRGHHLLIFPSEGVACCVFHGSSLCFSNLLTSIVSHLCFFVETIENREVKQRRL